MQSYSETATFEKREYRYARYRRTNTGTKRAPTAPITRASKTVMTNAATETPLDGDRGPGGLGVVGAGEGVG